ncbi:hypothetical protein BH10CHL1_BH10CHL1_46200 [soil metagenome]
MSQRAQELVQRFNATNAEMISYIENCSEGDLDRVTADEGWPVRVTAHHLAVSHEPVAGLAQLLANSQPLPPLTLEIFHHGNAQHAAEYATVSKQTILDALQNGGAKAGAIVSGLSDEALDRAGHFTLINADITAQGVIENILIGHISSHLESIKAAVGK